jgi:hypothetical protein
MRSQDVVRDHRYVAQNLDHASLGTEEFPRAIIKDKVSWSEQLLQSPTPVSNQNAIVNQALETGVIGASELLSVERYCTPQSKAEMGHFHRQGKALLCRCVS